MRCRYVSVSVSRSVYPLLLRSANKYCKLRLTTVH